MGYPDSGKKTIRVRFAPSPTGPMHAGNVRTAIFNWLFARRNNGVFILRIEDTDKERSKQEYSEEIEESLKWLGMDWDEGPFYQSQHAGTYAKLADTLLADGKLYRCFCSKEELEAGRTRAAKASIPPVYSGKCRKIPAEESERRKGSEPYALRFRVEGNELRYHDTIRGDVSYNLKLLGDFIVVRPNGQATYNLAAAVDDGMMKISHVIRGEDHISNTPPQLLLMEAIGFDKPVYAHLPLILADDGTKLSKRHGRFAFSQLVEEGYLPEAVMNFLALIGWSSEDKEEDMGIDSLVKKFSLDRVAVRSSKYDLQKLDWFNRRKIHNASPERLLEHAGRFIKKHERQFADLPEEKKLALLGAVRENISHLTELDDELVPFFEYAIDPEVKSALVEYPVGDIMEVLLSLCETDDFGRVTAEVKEKTGAKGKALFMPLRAAFSGRLHGPELKFLYRFFSAGEREYRLKRFMEHMK